MRPIVTDRVVWSVTLVSPAKTADDVWVKDSDRPSDNTDLLTSSSGEIERVSHFKLLAVYIDFTLAWNIHTRY